MLILVTERRRQGSPGRTLDCETGHVIYGHHQLYVRITQFWKPQKQWLLESGVEEAPEVVISWSSCRSFTYCVGSDNDEEDADGDSGGEMGGKDNAQGRRKKPKTTR